jgi:hypothetical protein
MLLLIRRDPRMGTLGKLKYVISVRAELSKTETALVRVNKLEDKELLLFDATVEKPGTAGAILRLMRDANLTVAKLIEGIMLTCDDIDQLMGVEVYAVEAGKNLQRYLTLAATFGRESVIDLGPPSVE